MKTTWTERTYAIRDSAVRAAYGLRQDAPGALACPDPNDPTPAEELLLRAKEAFEIGQQCRGWDLVDEAEGYVNEGAA